MSLVNTGAPFLRGAYWPKKSPRQATDAMHASTVQARELEALKRAQKAHARSMMALVHELRSPAAASKSMVATARFLHSQDVQLDDFLARRAGRMDQLLQLVDDILDLSQAKAGRPLGQVAALDLVAETRSVCEPYLEEAAAKGLAMSLELPEAAVRMQMADKAYQLIVSNLVSNAVKYTPAGSVRVTLRKEGTWAVLRVQDTGIGIPANEIRHLFTEFFRATNARAGCALGTGLGLAVVRALVEDCNGELALHSEENRGSRFTVRLPVCKGGIAQKVRAHLRAGRKLD
jgi:signal transduction histidine kinase